MSSRTPSPELCPAFPQVQGDNSSDLDFGAVQRGDPEMEQKMNRVIRACVEAARGNPICSLHDQGAGGNGERRGSDKGAGRPGLLPDSAQRGASRICDWPPSPGSHPPPPVPSGEAPLWGVGSLLPWGGWW